MNQNHSELVAAPLERLRPRLGKWSAQLRAAGLDGLTDALLDAAAPLGALGAQLLWVAQPVLGIFMTRDWLRSLDDLAHVLSEPQGVTLLRQRLFGDEKPADPK